MPKFTILAIFLALAVVGGVVYVASVKRVEAPPAYVSQADCEQKTGKRCDFKMCDYVPPGKTFQEVCGSGSKGWQPVGELVPSPSQPADISNWQTYRNEEYGFEFKYPPVGKIVAIPPQNPHYQYLFAVDLGLYPGISNPESDYLNKYLYVISQTINPDLAQSNFTTKSGIEGVLDSYTTPSKISLRRGNGAVIFQFGCSIYCSEGSEVLIEITKTFRFLE